MQMNYSKQAVKFLQKQDMITRTRIVTAINNLPQGDVKNYDWDNIETITPDDWNKEMLAEIETNPDCHVFVSAESAMSELGL